MSRISARVDLESLERVGPVVQRFVREGNLLPGVKFLLWHRGEQIDFRCVGFRDLEKQLAVEEDTIFRIYSMTKPLVSVALMMFFQEGRFQLSSPALDFIPEFRNVRVYLQQAPSAQRWSPKSQHGRLPFTICIHTLRG